MNKIFIKYHFENEDVNDEIIISKDEHTLEFKEIVKLLNKKGVEPFIEDNI